MNWIHPASLLLATLLVAFAECRVDGLRAVLAAQPYLLPALVVYAALSTSLGLTAATAVVGGIAADALSSGPLGLSVVSLALVGVALHLRRDVLLRESAWAQALLGGAGTLAVSVVSLALIFALWPLVSSRVPEVPYLPEQRAGLTALPELGLHTLWQWVVVTLTGAMLTPVVFRVFHWIDATFQYQRVPDLVYRANREIKRGRF